MIYPGTAQKAIDHIINALRTDSDFDAAFNRALETLQKEFDGKWKGHGKKTKKAK